MFSQNNGKETAASFLGVKVRPKFEVAYRVDSLRQPEENTDAEGTEVTTDLYQDGRERIGTGGSFLHIDAESWKSFPAGTEFKVIKATAKKDRLELTLAPASGPDFGAIRVFLGKGWDSLSSAEAIKKVNDMLAGTYTAQAKATSAAPDPARALVDFPIDTGVLTPLGPTTLTKGDVTVTVVPNTTPSKPQFTEHLEPFHPTIKEAIFISCGNATISLSTSNRYFKKSYIASTISQRKLGESDAVVNVTNNGEHTIRGEGIPMKWKVGDGFGHLTGFINGDVLGAIPVPIENFGKDITPGDTKKLGVLAMPYAKSESGASVPREGEFVSIALYDVPTKTDAAGNPTARQTFEFKFKVTIQHDIVKAVQPPPETVCRQ